MLEPRTEAIPFTSRLDTGNNKLDLLELIEIERPYSNRFFEKCVLVGPKLQDL